MFEKIAVIPTGDELIGGIILDTDSPMVIYELLGLNPNALILRVPPLKDDQSLITEKIIELGNEGFELLVLIGGSGGGHRFESSLGKDFTHSALEGVIGDKYVSEIYGKNGHLWCRLICGFLNGCLIINLPGPYEEAKAAIRAFKETAVLEGLNCESINRAMTSAVKKTYGGTENI